MTPEQLAEYTQMRQEILARATMHHQQVVHAVVLQFICVLVVVWLNSEWINWETTELFLFLIPILFAGLTYNYQANQCTMESVAGYLNKQYHSMGLKWEEFFGERKSKQKLVSFSKALPLIWPQFIPIAWWLTVGWPTDRFISALGIIDIVLLVITLLNFRYKLPRK